MEEEKKETKGEGIGVVEGWGGRRPKGVIGKVSPLVSAENSSLASGPLSTEGTLQERDVRRQEGNRQEERGERKREEKVEQRGEKE